MIDFRKLPVGTIISTYYNNNRQKPYTLIGIIIPTSTGTCLKVLEGGWNHSPFGYYGLADSSDTDYTDRKIISIKDYPYPEKLL